MVDKVGKNVFWGEFRHSEADLSCAQSVNIFILHSVPLVASHTLPAHNNIVAIQYRRLANINELLLQSRQVKRTPKILIDYLKNESVSRSCN